MGMTALMKTAAADQRETDRENIVTTMNMFGQQAGRLLANQKAMYNAAYYMCCLFGAYHVTKLTLAVGTATLLGALRRPQLVRETSRIVTRNPLAFPFVHARKFVQQRFLGAKTEEALLKGVVL